MTFQRELEEAQAYLKCNKITDRKKALESFHNLLNNDEVIECINKNDPFSWNELLEDSQNCLRKESDRVAETISKKGPLKNPDRNLELAIEFLVLIVKVAILKGEDKIKLSSLIKYVEGCLKERKMRTCRDPFLRMIKEYILPNPSCLGYIEQEDFILLFRLLKSELEKCSISDSSSMIVFNCFSLLIKHGPLSAFPTSFLREQFAFMSKFCQSVTQNDPRMQQEDAVEIVLNFCKHTAEDNRLSCIKLGEEVFATLLNLYCVSGHDSILKVNVVEFCLLQMTIHNPNGSLEGDSQALASNWHNWKGCVKKMYGLVTMEISQYLRQCVKNALFFVPHEKSTVILDSFVLLFVEVCRQETRRLAESGMSYQRILTGEKELQSAGTLTLRLQTRPDNFDKFMPRCSVSVLIPQPTKESAVNLKLFNETESPVGYSLLDNMEMSTQTQKRRKIEASLDSFVTEIQDTKSWVWVKLVGALLEKYPKLISKKLFLNLLQVLHTLQLEVKDTNTISYIYETQAILIDMESCLDVGTESLEITNLWKLVGDSTLRAVGLNQNIKETQNLLQKLISRNIVNIESVIQTFTSGVLIITEHHLNTLELVLENINFSQFEISKKEELFNSLLNSQNVKDYTCFLKINFAEILVALTLKQCPDFGNASKKKPKDAYGTLTQLYAKNNFDPKHILSNKAKKTENVMMKRTFNIDFYTVKVLIKKLKLFVDTSQEEPIGRLLCIVGLLYNTLSSMVNYEIILDSQIEECQILVLIKQLLSNESILSLRRYQTHGEKALKELLSVAAILDEIFSFRNNVTAVVKGAFTMEFLRELVNILNFFQNVARSKAELEHRVKLALTGALSKYCLISNAATTTAYQRLIMLLFAKPDYDFTDETDYDLGMSFLKKLRLASPGFLPEEAVGRILECLHNLCSAKYRSYISALDILLILKDFYQHLHNLNNIDYKNTAVMLLQPFYLRLPYYGPDIAIALLDGIEELCKVDPNCLYSTWDGKEVIKYVPQFLASDFQKVRYKAVEVLVNFLKISFGTTRLETIHRLEELFDLIYESNIKVFQVEGDLTDERRHDEIVFRASSALYTFLSIIINCNSWIENSLFAIIKLEHNKKLYNISNGELIGRVFLSLQKHFGCEDFIKKYVEKILSKWLNLGYNINEFECRMVGCSDKMDLYVTYFDICLPLLLKNDRNDLFAAAKRLDMTEKDVLEHCCTKIFGRALSSDIKNIGDQFVQKNVEVSYLSHVLGSRFKENLIENIDQVVSSLVSAVTDEKAIEQALGETILITSKGISSNQFTKCLQYIESFLCDGKPLIEFLETGKTNKIQKILLDLKGKVYSNTGDQQLKCFHQYTIFVNMLLKTLSHRSQLSTFFLRDTIYFLVHLIKSSTQDQKLSKAVVRYLRFYSKKILPDKSSEFEQFLIFTVNSVKNIAIDNAHLSSLCVEILHFLIVDKATILLKTIAKLDAFPVRPEFDKIRKFHEHIKYDNKKVSLQEEIQAFLEYNDIATRQDSLIHLKSILSKEKEQIKLLYDNLSEIRGFSEDCEQSLLHRLTSMLIKMSCYPNDNISLEAIKCLGELGPADLTTIVLEPEKRVLDIKCTPFELLTGHVVSLLAQYIVDPDINVVQTASAALYEILKFKEGKKVVDSHLDFGYGSIDKHFITPYIDNSQKFTSQVRIDLQRFGELINESELWCPSEITKNNDWVTSLVLALLKSFDYGCYLKNLVAVCNSKTKFCENILPLLIYLMISLNNNVVTDTLSRHINEFFSEHWKLTVSSSTDKNLIPVNKKSVKCMLDVINFIRQQPSISSKLGNLKLNYLPIAKAAAFCSAHFSALLYAELWCQGKITAFELEKPRDGAEYEHGYTLLDYIYEHVSEEIGITLQQILQSAYKSIGDLDALSGCGISLLLRPEQRVEYYKNTGQWEHVMNYYSMHPVSETNSANMIKSFKMNQLYQLPLLCQNLSKEPEYECLWRLGQWNVNKKDNIKSNDVTMGNYEKYKFSSLKALCDSDHYTFTTSKNQLSMCIINNLKHTSLESSKNLYPIFSQLQSLIEMDDCLKAMDSRSFEEVLGKWRAQDLIIRKNDFQFVEPIAAQRMTVLSEYIKKDPGLKKAYFDMVLNFADYSKEECHIRVAQNAIINIRKLPDLDGSIEKELQFREAQLAWLNGDKMIAQHLLRKLCKAPDITPRLKASCLKLQGVYMAEMYSDKTSILNSFYGSIQTHKDIQRTSTAEDYKNLQDIYDKIATFADREYQQIMSHVKSDLFQKKLSNIKSCKEMAVAMNEQKKKKTDDERKAQIIHERQIKIDENEINTTLKDKEQDLALALKFYIKNLSACDTNDIKIFRVMALFLENRDNKNLVQYLKNMVEQIPSYKYITMLPQLIPHISTNQNDLFSQQINQIIEKCAVDHPHHTLPLLLALVNANKDKEYSNPKTKVTPNERSLTAIAIVKKLRKRDGLSDMIDKMLKLSDALIELAYYVDVEGKSSSSRKTEFNIPSNLKIRKIRNFDDILVPTYTLPVSKTNTYDDIVGISNFTATYKTVGGINAPKRIECRCTSGKSHSQLVKGQDDLRQDAVMEQVFTIMTNLLSTNKQTKSLLIRTYKIVPLSMRSGILEWVDNSMPIGDYLAGNKDMDYVGAHREFRRIDKTPNDCRVKFRNCSGKSNEEKLATYNSICKEFQPVFHKFFETHFRQPSVWYERKRAYIHSVATTSMCGYILGIGDRHVSNILIDKQTAEVIHIDFGIAFEQGKCLPTPETVPFRLTRDIVDGMGVSGIEGLFRKSCEKTMEVLRSNSQTILTILEVLLYDPLYFWTVSAAEANRRQTDEDNYSTESDESEDESKNISAQRALLRLRGKLQGTEEGKPSSVEQQVGTLIQQAMDPANLCRLFNGWQPYL